MLRFWFPRRNKRKPSDAAQATHVQTNVFPARGSVIICCYLLFLSLLTEGVAGVLSLAMAEWIEGLLCLM